MGVRFNMGKLGQRLIMVAGLVAATTAAQAVYLISHTVQLNGSLTMSSIAMYAYQDGSNSDVQFDGSAGPGGTTVIDDPTERALMTVRGTVIGLIGGKVTVALNSDYEFGAGDWDTLFGLSYSEATIATALTSSDGATLKAFLDLHQSKFAAEGQAGYLYSFSTGILNGLYHYDEDMKVTSVPEPATMILAGSAAGLGYWRRRRAKTAA